MFERVARTPVLLACIIVAVIAVAHRMTLFVLHRADLDALIATNPGWYTFQQLPVEMLRDHLFRSLLYLQQTPPFPNLLMGIVTKVAEWPVGASYLLIALNTLVTIVTVLVLVHIVSILYPGRVVLWVAIGLLFLLNADLVVLEYNSLGQTLYETLAMLLVLLVVDRLVVFHRGGRLWHAVLAGMATGLLSLTRATWCLFPLAGVLQVAWLAPARRGRAVLAYLVPVLLLQGGWAVKNWALYGFLSPATSTMGGIHMIFGMQNAGLREEIERFTRERVSAENGDPDWAVAFARGDPARLLAIWEGNTEPDREIERAMGFPNTRFNTVGNRMVSEWGQRLWIDFAVHHPRIMLVKWWRGYVNFWRPIASYGRLFVALFAGGASAPRASDPGDPDAPSRYLRHVTSGLDVPGILRRVFVGQLPGAHELKSGTCMLLPKPIAPCIFTPSSMYTLRWLEPFLLVLNVIAVHVLLPLVAIAWVVRRVRPHDLVDSSLDRLRLVALVIAATTYAYLAVTANVIETSENMRYRLEVEPVVWLVTLLSASELGRLAQGAWHARRAARTDTADRCGAARVA